MIIRLPHHVTAFSATQNDSYHFPIMNDLQNQQSNPDDISEDSTDFSCEDFLPMASESTSSGCQTCGNHECSRRQIEPESIEAAQRLGAPAMILWSSIIFIFPLVIGIIGSYALALIFPPSAEWKSIVGFLLGLILGVAVAWAARISFLKSDSID